MQGDTSQSTSDQGERRDWEAKRILVHLPHSPAQLSAGCQASHALTLAGVSALAEQRPNVIFIVDSLADPAGDWATWVAPRVVLR